MIADDMAEKKLRGSGGYAVAKITDEEQKKGNLGGPELFLAGIGRLDEDRFLRYHCNKCEKDYEGSPAIIYENPNEELGEGVTLLEKGEYKCKTCNSTIAQYRKFEAPDTQQLPEQTQSARVEEESVPPSDISSIPPSTPSAVAGTPTAGFVPIQSLVGMSAYDSEAILIGKVEQIGLRKVGSDSQIIIKAGNKEIPWGEISKIGDIVLVKAGPSKREAAQSSLPSGKCPSCGYQNEADAAFCEECGTKLT
ncbi:MAG TPA: zinc-ribbon domain-containing protein [Nitrososphaera sp.]|nr:zinc-ribbon domain-containing protein [Nitrososphaera sp.]